MSTDLLFHPLANILDKVHGKKGVPRLKDWLRKALTPQTPHSFRLPCGMLLNLNLQDIVERNIWQGTHRDDYELLDTLVQPGEVFIDVGANIGIWSLYVARILGDGGKVFSFEPSPLTASRLREHILGNHLDSRIEVMEMAVSNRTGKANFSHQDYHAGGSHLSTGKEQGVEVQATSLDESFPTLNPQWIKIDVEGHEIEVLEGARQMIERSRPCLILEYNPLLIGKSPELKDFPPYSFLNRFGYHCFHFKPGHFNPSQANGDHWTYPEYTNLLFTTKPIHDRIM